MNHRASSRGSSLSSSNSSALSGASARPHRGSSVSSLRSSVSGYASPVTYSPGSSISSGTVRAIEEDNQANVSRTRRSRMRPPTPPPMPNMPYISDQAKILGLMATLKPLPSDPMATRVYAARLLYKLRHDRLESRVPNLYSRAFWLTNSGQEEGLDHSASSKQFRMALFSVRFIELLRAMCRYRFTGGPDSPWFEFHVLIRDVPPIAPITDVNNPLYKTNIFARKLQAEKNRCMALNLLEPVHEQYVSLMQAADDYTSVFSSNSNPWPPSSDPIHAKRLVLLEQAVSTSESSEL